MKFALLGVCVLLLAGLGVGGWLLLAPDEPVPPREVVIVDRTVTPPKARCASCGDARHPTPELLEAEFHKLMAQYAADNLTDSEALDSLCFYGVQTRDMLAVHGTGPLDDDRAAFLRREVTRTHAYLSVRVIDDAGVERVTMMRKRVPFDIRCHHEVDGVNDVTPPSISGTLKRVGLYHIWARF
jgi:hypothetical protein